MTGEPMTGWKPIPLGVDETLGEFRYGGRLMLGGADDRLETYPTWRGRNSWRVSLRGKVDVGGGLMTGWKPVPHGVDETLDEFRYGGSSKQGGLMTGWKPIPHFCGGGTMLPP